ALEGQLLLVGKLVIRPYVEEVFRLCREAGKHVLRIAVVLVGTTEPLPYRQVFYSRNEPDFVAVIDRERLRERDAVTRDQAERLTGRRIAQEQSLVHGDEYAENAQGNRDAPDSQNAAPPVAQTILQNERQIAHNVPFPLFYRDGVHRRFVHAGSAGIGAPGRSERRSAGRRRGGRG